MIDETGRKNPVLNMVGTIKIQIPCLFHRMKLLKGIDHNGSGRKNPDSNREGTIQIQPPVQLF